MSEIIFPGDAYDTPDNAATFWSARFPSLIFLWKVLAIVRNNGKLAAAGKYHGKEWCEGSLNTLRALEQCGVHVHVRGMDNIDKVDGPCVFIANHMSTLETFVLPVFIQPRKSVTYVVKESLIKYPWFGPVVRARDPIVVTRDNPRKDLAAVLEGGWSGCARAFPSLFFPRARVARPWTPSSSTASA